MFKLIIDTDNDVFVDDVAGQLTDCLWKVAGKLKKGATEGPVVDAYGNTVGRFVLADKNQKITPYVDERFDIPGY